MAETVVCTHNLQILQPSFSHGPKFTFQQEEKDKQNIVLSDHSAQRTSAFTAVTKPIGMWRAGLKPPHDTVVATHRTGALSSTPGVVAKHV